MTETDLSVLTRTNGYHRPHAAKPRFVWPDGLFADNSYVYVTLGQWTRLPQFHNGVDMRKPPFIVARMSITAP